MCIYIPLNFVGYFHISKYNLKLCWTCFSNHIHMICFFSWASEKFVYIPHIFPNVIQIYWKNSYICNINSYKTFIHISDASISFPILFKYIGKIHIYTITTSHKKCSKFQYFSATDTSEKRNEILSGIKVVREVRA